MTNMFKKSLVAAAIAGISVTATAAEVSFDGQKSTATDVNSSVVIASSEYLGGVTGDLNLGTIATPSVIGITLGANYTDNDRIFLTFSGDSVDADSLPDVWSTDDGTGPPADNSIELGKISSEVNSSGDTVVVYRVTDVQGVTNGLTLELNQDYNGDGTADKGELVNFDPAKLIENDGVKLSFRAETNDGLSLDTSGGPARSVSLVDTASEYAFAITQWNNRTIDVADSRESFVGGATSTTGSFIVLNDFQLAGEATTFDSAYSLGTPSTQEFTISGDFGFAFDDEGDADTAVLTSTFDEASASEIVTSTSSVIFDFAGLAEAISIPAQSFGLSATLEAGGRTFDVAGSGSSWVLNGSVVNVSYMPYRDSITQVINVTNRSAQSGDISVVAVPENGGDSIDLGVVAESPANSIVRIAGDVIDALNAETGVDHEEVGTTTRYALQIVTNAPSDSVEVYSAYNVGGSGARLVVNDSNGASDSASDKNTMGELLEAACESDGTSTWDPAAGTCS